MKSIKQCNINEINKNTNENMYINGNLALNFEEKTEYEEPKIKRLVIKQSPKKFLWDAGKGVMKKTKEMDAKP